MNLDVTEAIKQGFVWGMAGAAFNFPTEWGTILGLASSVIKVDMELALQPKRLPPELKDYAYLYHTQKYLGN